MTDYDAFYHRLFDHAGMVAMLLREFVPEPWLDEFDLEHIARENTDFHADGGQRRHGDTAWRIPKRNGDVAYVLILLEFQSTIDRWMALRVLVYVGLLWQHLLNNKTLLPDGRLPPVLPIVLYNGNSTWTAPLALNELVGLPERSPLWKWQPDIRYYIIDESRYSEAELAKRDGLMALLFRVEGAAHLEQFRAVTDALVAWFGANPAPATLKALFVELLRSAIEPLAPGMQVPDELLEIKNMLALRVEAWKQEWKQEALQEGLQQGLQQGRQEGRLEGEVAFLRRLLEQRFGVLPDWVATRIATADTGALEGWGVRVLDARSLDDVFA